MLLAAPRNNRTMVVWTCTRGLPSAGTQRLIGCGSTRRGGGGGGNGVPHPPSSPRIPCDSLAMKITVNLEIGADEVPLATELLAVLRQLTDHVSVTQTDGAGGSAAGAGAAAPPLTPAAAAPSTSSAHSSVADLHRAASSASGMAAAAPNGMAAAAGAPPAISFPPGTAPQQQMEALIRASETSEHPEPLARQLEGIIQDPTFGGVDAMFPAFMDIWSSIALNPQLPAEERSAVPFVMLLQGLSQGLRDKFRDRMMRALLKHLTIPRPPGASRAEYYVQAEAFAALVSIEIVPIDGAIQTMCTLAKNPDKRGAAVTMLGKTVELASYLIAEKVPADKQELMRTTVAGVTDEEFHYDVEYIQATMGWTPGAAGPTPAAGAAGGAAAGGAPLRSLRPIRSLAGNHEEMVFSLAVDAAHQQFVSGGKDKFLNVWSQDGGLLQKLELGDLYISAMDFHPRLNMLLCSCVNPATSGALRLAGFTSGQPNMLAPRGFVQRDDMKAVPAVRALPETTGFVTGETLVTDLQQVIRYWDAAAAPSFQAMQPTVTFRGHASIPTALRAVGGEPNLFVSGDKDGCMLLWDLRTPQPAGAFGAVDAIGKQKAHALMITSIETAGPLLVTGSTDKTVALWDARRLNEQPQSRVPGENMTVLKLALNASHHTVAVSFVNGMRLLDITNTAAPVLSDPLVPSWPDGVRRTTYHDLKWNDQMQLLYAAGKERVIDIYAPGF